MTDQKFKYHILESIKDQDFDPEFTTRSGIQFEQKLSLELTNLDISIVNGLRRTVLAEVETVAINPKISLEEEDNITVFNTEMLRDRLSLIPIHTDSYEDLEELKKRKLVFKIADRADWSKPIKNDDNHDRIITCKDILVLEKKFEHEEVDIPKEAKKDLPLEEDDADELGKAKLGDSQADILPKDDKTNYNLLDSKDFFKYGDAFLAVLKKGESLYATMAAEIGTGLKHARWHSCVPIYRFKSKKEYDNPDYDWRDDEKYDPVKDIQNYQLSKHTEIAKYRSPEIFQLTLEYNGHYRPRLAWLLAIQTLRKKMEWFLEQVRLIDGNNGTVTDRLRVEFSAKDRIKNLVTLTVIDESHTLGNIMASHYLYNLERLVKIINPENSEEIILSGFSHYRVPHVLDPVENKLLLVFKTPEWSDKQVVEGFDKFNKSLQSDGEIVNSYDEDFYMKNPTIRLLMIVIERVLIVVKALEKETRDLQ